MRNNNTQGKTEFITEHIFWLALAWIWYRSLLFRCVPQHTLTESKLILLGFVLVFSAVGILFQIEAQLKPSGFYRCNYCYLVNLRHVGFLDGSEVTVGQYKLQISRNRRKEFLQQLTQFYGRGGR